MRFNQTSSPLSDSFFSDSNQELIQQTIISDVGVTTGYKIGAQNSGDLNAIMGKVYTDMRIDTETSIDEQVSNMNQNVVSIAVDMIIRGIKSNLLYLNDISKPRQIPDLPTNTSLYGTRLNR
jgi:hypothetical protein